MNTRQALEQAAVGRVQQLVAPHDRAAQRPLALRDVGRAGAGQVEPALEPLVDRRRRQEPDPRGGELDGERHAAQVGDDRRDVARVGVGDREARLDRAPARDEQPDRLEAGEGVGLVRTDRGGQLLALERSRAGRGRAGRGVPGPGTPARRRSAAARGSWQASGSRPAGAAARRCRPGRRAPARGCRGRAGPASTRAPSPARRSGCGTGRRRCPSRARSPERRGPYRSTIPSGTNQTPSGYSSARLAATWSASRVLPVPPGPVRVSSRVAREQGAHLVELASPARRTTSAPSAGCWGARRATGSAGSRTAGRRSRAGRSVPAAGP